MPKKIFYVESDFAELAKQARQATGKRKVEVARELGVAPPSVFNAEEHPNLPLHKLRIRMIETYSKYKVVGPVYYLERK
jgi:DNA-binding XRE family transcriptional regulator